MIEDWSEGVRKVGESMEKTLIRRPTIRAVDLSQFMAPEGARKKNEVRSPQGAGKIPQLFPVEPADGGSAGGRNILTPRFWRKAALYAGALSVGVLLGLWGGIEAGLSLVGDDAAHGVVEPDEDGGVHRIYEICETVTNEVENVITIVRTNWVEVCHAEGLDDSGGLEGPALDSSALAQGKKTATHVDSSSPDEEGMPKPKPARKERPPVLRFTKRVTVGVVHYSIVEGALRGNGSVKLKGARRIRIPDGVESLLDWPIDTDLDSVEMPLSLRKMQSAFSLSNKIRELHIPDVAAWCGLECIDDCVPTRGADLYVDGEKVTRLVVPGYAKTVNDHVFAGCKSIETAVFEEGVEEIGTKAFFGCSSLKRVKIPKTVKRVGIEAFGGCPKLREIVVAPDSDTFEAAGGMLCNKKRQSLVLCPASVTDAVVPPGVKSIGQGAFAANAKLKSVVLGDGLAEIGARSFTDCTALEKVAIPKNVVTIGKSAFQGCTALREADVASSATFIGPRAFQDCRRLRKFSIPDGVLKIGENTFLGCNALDLEAVMRQSRSAAGRRK